MRLWWFVLVGVFSPVGFGYVIGPKAVIQIAAETTEGISNCLGVAIYKHETEPNCAGVHCCEISVATSSQCFEDPTSTWQTLTFLINGKKLEKKMVPRNPTRKQTLEEAMVFIRPQYEENKYATHDGAIIMFNDHCQNYPEENIAFFNPDLAGIPKAGEEYFVLKRASKLKVAIVGGTEQLNTQGKVDTVDATVVSAGRMIEGDAGAPFVNSTNNFVGIYRGYRTKDVNGKTWEEGKLATFSVESFFLARSIFLQSYPKWLSGREHMLGPSQPKLQQQFIFTPMPGHNFQNQTRQFYHLGNRVFELINGKYQEVVY